jgi:MFS family permease
MVSVLADLFPARSRGAATGVLHLGVYLGFGLSQALGIHLTRLDLLGLGWRPVYLLAGLPGLALAPLLATLPDPRERRRRKLAGPDDAKEETMCLKLSPEKTSHDDTSSGASFAEDMALLGRTLCSPLLLIMFLAAATRHCAGFTWAYNARLYFLSYFPQAEVRSPHRHPLMSS